MTAELGAGPLALARAQRAHTARTLLETTDLRLVDIAFAAGFASVRQFNDTVREVFASTPTELRARRRRGRPTTPGAVELACRPRAVRRRRPARVPRRPGRARHRALGRRVVPPRPRPAPGPRHRRPVTPAAPTGRARCAPCLRLADWRDLTTAVRRVRRLLDLDADPPAVDERSAADEALAAVGRQAPGRPRARQRRPVRDGREGDDRPAGLRRRRPHRRRPHRRRRRCAADDRRRTADARLAVARRRSPASTRTLLPMPWSRRRTIGELRARVADGALVLDAGVDRDEVAAACSPCPGIGPWTADYVRMRGLGDPDVFLPTDLGVKPASACSA